MMYYRVALRKDQSSQWQWKSGMLSTISTLFDFISMYDRVPQHRLRIFFASSSEYMDDMLVRENSGLVSNSITMEEFLKNNRKIDRQRIKELEFELGLHESKQLIAKSVITRKLGDEQGSMPASSAFAAANHTPIEAAKNNRANNLLGLVQEDSEWSIGGDHDTPYTFALPVSTPQALAWARLLVKVQNGELIP